MYSGKRGFPLCDLDFPFNLEPVKGRLGLSAAQENLAFVGRSWSKSEHISC